MAEEEQKKKEASGGAPAWMVTFADLMTLLLCFFVLLLSFSVMESSKFKKMIGSLDEAFGVAKERNLAGFIEMEAGPLSNQLKSMSIQKEIEYHEPEECEYEPSERELAEEEYEEASREQQDKLLRNLASSLGEELKDGVFTAEAEGNKLVVHFPNSVAFTSGSDEMTPQFMATLKKLSKVLDDSEGEIIIAGHTDDRPISTEEFRSNWELSSARAVSVLHALEEINDVDRTRFVVEGHADTKPISSNDTEEGRANNRRVDIILTGPPKDEILEY